MKPVLWPARVQVRRALLRWFDASQRDLPWRRSRDPYAIWVSEVMLQQTQVSTAIGYWQAFLERFPTVQELAKAPLPQVLAAWRGLGYYARARNLKAAAEEIVAQHDGQLPRTVEGLRQLPGFGRYTAGAVASIAFGEQAPLVDGNVARVLSRLCEVEGVPGERSREERLWELAQALVKGSRPGDLNQALMELGALVCRVEAHCPTCPVRRGCRALASGRVEELPRPRVRAKRKRLVVPVAVFEREGEVLLGLSEGKGLFGGLWELPSLTGSLAGAKVGKSLGTVRRTLTHRDLELKLFPVRSPAPKRLEGYGSLCWASVQSARELGISTAMLRALEVALGQAAESPGGRRKKHSVG